MGFAVGIHVGGYGLGVFSFCFALGFCVVEFFGVGTSDPQTESFLNPKP